MVLTIEAVLSELSETLYVMEYVPATELLTEPLTSIEEVRSPSISSVAVAPGSVNVFPTKISIEEDPVSVITGGVVSGIITVIVPLVINEVTNVFEEVFPKSVKA